LSPTINFLTESIW